MDYAAAIANGPTQALAKMKENMQSGLMQSLEDSLALEAKHMITAGGSDEAREAITAFREKRKPVFHKIGESGENG